MNTFLQRIKEKPRRMKIEKYTREELELAIEWITGNISNSDYCFARRIKNRGSIPYVEATKIIRNASINGELKIRIK